MKIEYNGMIPGITFEINTTQTRSQFAEQAAEKYLKETGKNRRSKQRIVEAFERDAGAYHKVRAILEDIKTDNFEEVAEMFRKLYPEASKDWKSALECGVVVKAERTVGNYYNGEYIFNCELSKKIREAGINGDIEGIVFNHIKN